MKSLIQAGDYGLQEEKRRVQVYCDDVLVATASEVDRIAFEELKSRTPIGSVEFTEHILARLARTVPGQITYPDDLRHFLGREVRTGVFSNADGNEFVKPRISTKEFNGAIKAAVSERVDPFAIVYISEFVPFREEWRVYVYDGAIMGMSRYDNFDTEPQLERAVFDMAMDMVGEWRDAPIAYTLDIGHIGDRKLLLVEVNDAWALGWYPWGDMTFPNYWEMITARWQQIISG